MSSSSCRPGRILAGLLPGLLFLACSTPSTSPLETPDTAATRIVNGEIGTALDRAIADLVDDGFSGAALVALEGQVLLQNGYGLADVESNLPVAPGTLFEIGTMAKIFTAAAILKLEADGELSLDDKVETFTGPLAGQRSEATLHHLLTHTSGLFANGVELDDSGRDAFLESVQAAQGAGQPGEDYHYSNAGYTVLAAVVEMTSGMAFEDYVQTALFAPARMNRTGFVWDYIDPETGKALPQLATGYEGQFEDDLTATSPPEDQWGNRGPSGIVTTVGDLYRWIQALEAGTILPPASVERMFTAFQGRSGYAWQAVDDSSLGRLVRRGGNLPAYEASIRWYRDADLVVILALNGNRGHRIKAAKEIAAALAPYVEPPPAD